ncbi:MMPL family transporter [Legionella maioricensis]|uniref:MMPL family transporter n=1 Tax=Legionella maioricensis TaxID=2896528 RepID=A0A9X2CZ64_9GAMM|nr:MMPL family transporter [Legionella maioricensis]MCL9683473.1 MMPL family transporter [Legionella maioricensis]MCL9686772.1 MMPL family transporter [Legionella maioricensis]
MQNIKFYLLGKFIYKLRWPIILLWVLILLSCLPFLPHIITPFKTTGFIDEHSSSAIAEERLDKELGYDSKNKLMIMYYSPNLLATNPLYLKKIKQSLADLEDFPLKHEIIFPDKKKQISKDKHTAYVVVIIKTNKPISDKLFDQFKASIKNPSNMTVQTGGEPFFIEKVTKQTQVDLYKADFIATPVAIITMILVFGSVVAAFLPVVLGGGCALIILTTLYFLGHLFTLSIFTLNIALLLGLCLSLDYSLFVISRFRDELDNGLNTIEAIAVTQAHAGKAIFFSGLAVLVSLSALFLFPINILFSVAVGGLIAVLVAMLIAIILLPAILSVLDKKINLLSVRSFRKDKKRPSIWHWIAERVVNYPLMFFCSVLILLLLLGYPFLSATFGISDYKIFPEKSENRKFYDTYAEKFNINELTPILLVVKSQSGPILSKKNLYKLYDLTKKLEKNPLIKKVNSIVTTDSDLTKKQYYTLYHTQQGMDKADIKKLLATTTHKHVTVISVVSKYPIHSPQTDQLITDLHKVKSPGLSIQITGKPVSNKEVLECIYHVLPYAILWIMVFSYLILLLLLRSLFLPFKAILMNLLSLSACYGALVLVFQDGYLSHLLNFQPQGLLDISLLVIIFCALFGFSMDYEVFLLSRIKEAHEMSGNNRNSIVFGIEKSSRIITSAAIIVIVLCGSFLVADVLMVKAFGLGIAVAIFVDAFLIRTLLVPATMALLESWNWYLPKWLDKILPKF